MLSVLIFKMFSLATWSNRNESHNPRQSVDELIIKDQKILTNVSAQLASQANTASQTLMIVKSTLAKTEELVLILLTTTNATA